MLHPGDTAPDFTLPDQAGTMHHLADYRGKWVLLYFYPKDDTPGCTTEACMIRDIYDDIAAQNAVVLGISKDTVQSHEKFAAKYELPFAVLADPSEATLQTYGAIGEKNMFGKKRQGTLRISYLISPEGIITKAYPKVKPTTHALEVLADIQQQPQT